MYLDHATHHYSKLGNTTSSPWLAFQLQIWRIILRTWLELQKELELHENFESFKLPIIEKLESEEMNDKDVIVLPMFTSNLADSHDFNFIQEIGYVGPISY